MKFTTIIDIVGGTANLHLQFHLLSVCFFLYQVGSLRSSDEEKRVGIQKLLFCPSSGKLLVGGAGGHVTLFTFESEGGERHIETSMMDFTAGREGYVWNGPDALSVKADVTWSKASYQPSCVVVANPPVACTGLAASHNQL